MRLPVPVIATLAASAALVCAAAVKTVDRAFDQLTADPPQRGVSRMIASGSSTRLPEPRFTIRHGRVPLIRGTVLAPITVPHGIRGCGVDLATGPEGRFEFRAPNEACELRAWVEDGALRDYGPAITVHPDVSVVRDILLEAPAAPLGGLGARIDPAPGGVRLDSLRSPSAGRAAGLVAGDVITGIDGTSTVGMPIEQFQSLVVGTPGTPVMLTVQRGRAVFSTAVVRQRVEE